MSTPESGAPDALAATMPLNSSQPLDYRVRRSRTFEGLFGRPLETVNLGRFTLLRRVGVGGMGVVYAAYDDQLDRKVAIKLVRMDARLGPAAEERLFREARTLARLNHPNVVQIHDVGRVDDRVFVAMEFIRGVTLQEWLERAARPGRRLPARDILRHFIAAGRGLQAAHEAGLVHHDFKPGNVLIGDDGRARVVDFGLAHIADPAAGESSEGADKGDGHARVLTRMTLRAGTPRYMSPEQIRGQVTDHRSDQFNFCVALYEALYGQPPFAGDTRTVIWAAVQKGEISEPPRGASAPQVVRKAVLRGLSKEPGERFESMAALLAELEKATQRHNRWRWALGGAAIAAIGISMAWYWGLDRVQAADPCARAGSEMARVWSEERQAALEGVFHRRGLVVEWKAVKTQLSGYASAWHDAGATACQARATQSTRLQDHTARCLARTRKRFSELVSELENRPGPLAQGTLHSNLYDPAICHSGAVLAAEIQPPPADLEEEIAEVEREIDRAGAQRIVGRDAEAVALAKAQVERAQELGYRPLLVEALDVLGSALLFRRQSGDRAEGEAVLERALALAQETGQDHLALEVLNDLIASAVLYDRDSSRGRHWSEMARTIVERIEAGPRQRAILASNRGVLAFKDEDHAMAVEHHQASLAEADKDADFPAALRALLHQNLGIALRRYCTTAAPPSGQEPDQPRSACLDRAEAAFQTSLEYFTAAGESVGPQIAESWFGLAMLEFDRGRLDTARDRLEDVLATHRDVHGTAHPLVGKVYWNLAVIDWQMKRLDRASDNARKAREIFEQTDYIHLADVVLLQGAIAFYREGPADALAYYEQARALQIEQLTLESSALGETLASIAEAHLELARASRQDDRARSHMHLDKARDAFDAAMKIQNKSHDLEAFLQVLSATYDELHR